MREGNFFVIIIIFFCLIFSLVTSCSSKEEKQKEVGISTQESAEKQVLPSLGTNVSPSGTPSVIPNSSADVIVEVNGKRFTKGQLDANVKKTMAAIKNKMPAERMENFKQNLRKGLIDDFITRTLLADEVKQKNIIVNDQEVSTAIESIFATLSPGETIDDAMKKNLINKKTMREEIRFRMQVNKLVLSSMNNNKLKPTDKEISNFYQKNKEKFKLPETVHARHILVAKTLRDDDKTKNEKRARAESLRGKLLQGADFADLAAKNSDCPSKQNGGDIGEFTRGQMVKPFDEAAFAQKVTEIGPVVETDFGYHIIQVLEHKKSQIAPFNEETKRKVASILLQQKQQDAFVRMLKKLRDKANITFYE